MATGFLPLCTQGNRDPKKGTDMFKVTQQQGGQCPAWADACDMQSVVLEEPPGQIEYIFRWKVKKRSQTEIQAPSRANSNHAGSQLIPPRDPSTRSTHSHLSPAEGSHGTLIPRDATQASDPLSPGKAVTTSLISWIFTQRRLQPFSNQVSLAPHPPTMLCPE
jgi:hypothetical protein